MIMSGANSARLWLVALLLLSIGASAMLLNQDAASIVTRVQGIVGDSPVIALALFALLSLVSQLLIVPSGSLLLMMGGFLLGALPAALIYALIQIITTGPVIWLGQRGGVARAEAQLEAASPLLAHLADSLRAAPFSLSLVLRLTPVIPSAVGCLLSVLFGIPRTTFILVTALVCWVRPLFFASIGAALPTLQRLSDPADVLDPTDLWPLLLVFIGALGLLLSRVWVNKRMCCALAKHRVVPDS